MKNKLLQIILFFVIVGYAQDPVIWSGEKITFSKLALGDADELTSNVTLVRGDAGGLYNSVSELGNSASSPEDTRWAYGKTQDGIIGLNFGSFKTSIGQGNQGNKPPVEVDLVLHLITDNIYIDIKFLTWETGGNYTYERSTNEPGIRLNGIMSAENNQIKNVANPTHAQDAVTKNYTYSKAEVDALILDLQNQIKSIDITPPVITLIGNQEVYVEKGTTYNDAGATTYDTLEGNLTDSIITTINVDTDVNGSYTVTYNLTDGSGNKAIEVVRTVLVTDSFIKLISSTKKATIESSPSFAAIGLNSYTQLTGFTTNNNGDLNVIGSNANSGMSYLMFSDDNNWNESTKVFMTEYNYDLNTQATIENNFSSGSGTTKTESYVVPSSVKYVDFSASGSNYIVNISIEDRTEPLYLILETYGSNNQFNFTHEDSNDKDETLYWTNLLGSGNGFSGLSNSVLSSVKHTKTLAYLDEILNSGAPNRVIWFSGDMIDTLFPNCSGPHTINFDPNYPEPEFTPKTLNGSNTFISSLSDGFENNIKMYMNCNTTYDNPPY